MAKDAGANVLGNLGLAVIGCGSMGGALIKGWCKTALGERARIVIFDEDRLKARALAEELHLEAAEGSAAAARDADIVVIAVKPKIVPEVLAELAAVFGPAPGKRLLVSIAAGVTCTQLHQWLGVEASVARVMPNLACMVGQGMSGVYAERKEDAAVVAALFSEVGLVEQVAKETELDSITAVSGCGPGFICLIMEAMADGGVKLGLGRERATRLAAQTVCGAAALVLETGVQPAQLKDMVSSPGGATIAGLHVLEQNGVRGAIMSALEASALRTGALTR